MADLGHLSHSSHWGAFSAAWRKGVLDVRAHPGDPNPSPILGNFASALRHPVRVTHPMIRKGWLQKGPGADESRGADDYVAVSWDEALDRLGAELKRVKASFGLEAIFGGSYGWSSAGRFHHAQSQVHRFLNTAVGGYVRSVNSYSGGAAEVILPHVMGRMEEVGRRNVTWEQIEAHTDVVLAFGGMALKNTQVASGGVSRHIERQSMQRAAARGCRFVCISPLKSDLPAEIDPLWLPIRPGTDTAMMLGLCHAIVAAGRHDRVFLRSHCDGWETFERYLFGRDDGIEKSVDWAAGVCGIDAPAIQHLADLLHGKRALVVVAHALQRSRHGEQPVWMAAVVASVLGQIGLPGGGYNYALGTMAHYGRRNNAVPVAALPQGDNGTDTFIPVARFTDMLLHPGETFKYNGGSYPYPHIRLAYWAGGNPFHHQQDLNRLARAVRRLDTFVIHDSAWTATARYADIVLPSTLSLEREDIGASPTDPLMVAMHRICPPVGLARDDYEIFADLADRLGRREIYCEGRSTRDWLRHLYGATEAGLRSLGLPAPTFDEFWSLGELRLPQGDDDGGMLRAFREDPVRHRLRTPSGKIQITSPAIAGFGYPDCPAHPAWLPSDDAPNHEYPLWLISNQPATRLHSQLDFGSHSVESKRNGREVCSIHAEAAAARGIAEGDIVRLFNDRGACLASAHLCPDMLPTVVQLPTGAWLDLVIDSKGRSLCTHGNPNVLTRDIGTSSLAQGSTGQLTRVQVERFDEPLPPVRAFIPPVVAADDLRKAP